MMGEGEGRVVIPGQVMDSVKTTLANLEHVETNLLQFLSLCHSDLITDLPPLQRAHSLFFLAKATSTIFSLRLKCSGIHPDEHLVKTELERIRLYEDKLERFIDLSKAPLRPSTTLNYQAATRFIDHSLPDLTPEQRKSMRDISKGEGPRLKYLERVVPKKRKYQSSEKKSAQSAANEFLEKAAREIFGSSIGEVKGPVRLDTSDDLSEV